MLNTAYRNSEVYGPNAELSGGVTQIFYQQSALHSNWFVTPDTAGTSELAH